MKRSASAISKRDENIVRVKQGRLYIAKGKQCSKRKRREEEDRNTERKAKERRRREKRDRDGTKQERGSKRTPFAVLPPAINNALAYKSASYTCRVNRARVCDLLSPFISCILRCHCPPSKVNSLPCANTLSLPRSEYPAFALAAGQPWCG